MVVAITLAKALKLKNRLAGRMAHLDGLVKTYNTVLAEQRDQVNVAQIVKERDEIMESLINLKSTIIRANAPIQDAILRKGELASRIEWLKTLNTTDGVQRHGYQNTEITYVAVIKKGDVEAQTRQMEKEIDALQDRMDEHNVNRKVEIDQRVLDLAS